MRCVKFLALCLLGCVHDARTDPRIAQSVPEPIGRDGAAYLTRRLWNRTNGSGVSSLWRCARAVVYTMRVQVSEVSLLFQQVNAEVPISEVPVIEKDNKSLFTGYRPKRDGYGFSSRRYQDEVPGARGTDDASPQTRFLENLG